MDRAALTCELLKQFQKGVPICARPYARMAHELGVSEAEILDCLAHLQDNQVLSRIGPVFEHRRAGSSTLAALSIEPAQLSAIAAKVSAHPAVNHNYAREHAYNLWFVVTGSDRAAVDQALSEIAELAEQRPLDLPMLQSFHIDLAFALDHAALSQLNAGSVHAPQLHPQAAGR
ncbi:Lrp/AsnC family transcriptional regulator [Atopomonas sediminilitoris]|uniref:Lrp/AsnC family transcriptional regulator n=1 Tax=Atopomonas sediminilitoris TaxID=2919919 RepID=UPI001F4EAED1|nr:Lrp/AsnC family transcriptional regulator [Atopomonas sediminilitoris]MCJ8170844.1 Lrp/AsnC family transcriptional regulator [Atopomonas sediminilitoris]